MKKIVSVLLVLTMVVGAFAVDVSNSARLGFNILNVQDVGNDNKSKKVSLFDLNLCTTEEKTVASDSFSLTAGTEFGGFKINLNMNMLEYTETPFAGWKDYNFYLQFGQFKVAAGMWGDGVFYAEQAKKDFDDTNMSGQGTLASLYKLGMIEGNLGKAFDNLVGINGNAQLSLYGEYKLAKVLPGDLIFTCALTDMTQGKKTNIDKLGITEFGDGDPSFTNVIGARIAYKQNKVINANVDLRFFTKDLFGFGLYVSPLMVKGLNATVGFTMIVDSRDAKTENGFGIDARARYAVNNKLSITEQFNFTKMTDGKGKIGIWNAFNVLYKLGSIWPLINFQFDGDKSADKDMVTKMYITPACVFVAGDGCQITAGCQIELNKNHKDDGNKTDIAIPVLMRVKF